MDRDFKGQSESQLQAFTEKLSDIAWERLLQSGVRSVFLHLLTIFKEKFPATVRRVLVEVRKRLLGLGYGLEIFYTFLTSAIVLRFVTRAVLDPFAAADFAVGHMNSVLDVTCVLRGPLEIPTIGRGCYCQ